MGGGLLLHKIFAFCVPVSERDCEVEISKGKYNLGAWNIQQELTLFCHNIGDLFVVPNTIFIFYVWNISACYVRSGHGWGQYAVSEAANFSHLIDCFIHAGTRSVMCSAWYIFHLLVVSESFFLCCFQQDPEFFSNSMKDFIVGLRDWIIMCLKWIPCRKLIWCCDSLEFLKWWMRDSDALKFSKWETGLDSSARPVSDELEHSGTSQDDGNAVYHCAVFSFPWVLWIALTPYILCKFQPTTVWIFGYCVELFKGTQVHSDYKFIHSNWFMPACVHRWCISWRWWRWSNRPSPSRACNTSSDCKGGGTPTQVHPVLEFFPVNTTSEVRKATMCLEWIENMGFDLEGWCCEFLCCEQMRILCLELSCMTLWPSCRQLGKSYLSIEKGLQQWSFEM